MMRKLLFVFAVFMAGTAMMFAQFPNIGILGGSTVTGWESDTDMVTTDGVIYTLTDVVITVPESDPGVKFRQDDAWTINWGGTGFPTGTAAGGNAPNIPATNGTYNVTFNLTTLAYSFVPVGVEYAEVTMAINEMLIMFSTPDGVHYSVDNVGFPGGNYSFNIDDTGTGWGASGFPTGTAVAGGTIPVPANRYNITFNLDTKAYSFDFVEISMIGLGIVTEDPGWVTDVDMTTADGVNYTLANHVFPGGEGKFRLNHAWTTAWGSPDFPTGTAVSEEGGPNLVITAGTYDVAFNRETGAYAFTAPTAGTDDFRFDNIAVYPNPSENIWNFNAGNLAIGAINITDLSGKVVFMADVDASVATVDATGFASGIYFAKLTSGNAVTTVKVIKK